MKEDQHQFNPEIKNILYKIGVKEYDVGLIQIVIDELNNLLIDYLSTGEEEVDLHPEIEDITEDLERIQDKVLNLIETYNL